MSNATPAPTYDTGPTDRALRDAKAQQSEQIRQQSLIQQRDTQLMQLRNLAAFRAQYASGFYNTPGGYMNTNPQKNLIGS